MTEMSEAKVRPFGAKDARHRTITIPLCPSPRRNATARPAAPDEGSLTTSAHNKT